jgi:hypothetical protein
MHVFGSALWSHWHASANFLLPAMALQLNEPRGAEGLTEIRQAYEFTLERLGQDLHSGSLWQEYITFLQVGQAFGRVGAMAGDERRGDVCV